MEKFVVEWLMFYIGGKLDPKQFGGLKGSNISHYMVELINFILYRPELQIVTSTIAEEPSRIIQRT